MVWFYIKDCCTSLYRCKLLWYVYKKVVLEAHTGDYSCERDSCLNIITLLLIISLIAVITKIQDGLHRWSRDEVKAKITIPRNEGEYFTGMIKTTSLYSFLDIYDAIPEVRGDALVWSIIYSVYQTHIVCAYLYLCWKCHRSCHPLPCMVDYCC